MKTGVFGGSFDPVHPGHIAVALAALRECGIDEVWMMVSPQNPLKMGSQPASESDRLEMLRLAVAGVKDSDASRIVASDYECRLPKPSYTINTLRSLQKNYPDRRFTLIVGEDNLRNFSLWRAHDEILRDFGIIVYPREKSASEIGCTDPFARNGKRDDKPDAGPEDKPTGGAPATGEMPGVRDKIGPGFVYRLRSVPLYPVSSTQIRALVGEGCDSGKLAALTFPAVAEYISRHGLYLKRDS